MPNNGSHHMGKSSLFPKILCIFLYFQCLNALSSPRSSSNPQIQTEIKYVNERRCLISPARSKDSSNVPLILIGGMAQTISSWEYQVGTMNRKRHVMVYECLGQGPYPPSLDSQLDSEMLVKYFDNVSLEKQANVLKSVITEVFPTASSVDIAGFSFGGRVAMATAAAYPKIIRKIHITGVPAERTPHARLILKSWISTLQAMKSMERQQNQPDADKLLLSSTQLIPFAWSSILSTYSPSFLAQNEKRIPKWVQSVSQQNTLEGILSLLEQTHTENINDPWHPISMANRIVSNKCVESIQLAVGSLDTMSAVKETKKLGKILDDINEDNNCIVKVYEGSGHAVMMEDGRTWRNDVIEFLES